MKKALAGVGFLFLSACVSTPSPHSSSRSHLPASSSASVGDIGRSVYKERCVACHGWDGRGNPSALSRLHVPLSKLDLSSARTLSMAEIVSIVRTGKEKMPSFANKLTPEKLAAVSAYVKEVGR